MRKLNSTDRRFRARRTEKRIEVACYTAMTITALAFAAALNVVQFL